MADYYGVSLIDRQFAHCNKSCRRGHNLGTMLEDTIISFGIQHVLRKQSKVAFSIQLC